MRFTGSTCTDLPGDISTDVLRDISGGGRSVRPFWGGDADALLPGDCCDCGDVSLTRVPPCTARDVGPGRCCPLCHRHAFGTLTSSVAIL